MIQKFQNPLYNNRFIFQQAPDPEKTKADQEASAEPAINAPAENMIPPTKKVPETGPSLYRVADGPATAVSDPAAVEKPEEPAAAETAKNGSNPAKTSEPATPETAESQESDESDLPKPGILHERFIGHHDREFNNDRKTPEKVTEIIAQDRKKLSDSEIADIRYNSRLLIPKAGEENDQVQIQNLKGETARRLRAYCDTVDEKWYTLNYQKVGGDKHEYGIGLGDVLLDPDIQHIIVKKSGSTVIKAHRGVVPAGQSHAGRLGFLDENNEYVATFTGDKFRILANEGSKNGEAAPEQEVDLKKPESVKTYISKYREEEKVRTEHKQIYELEEEADLNISIDEKKYSSSKPISEEEIVGRLNSKRVEKDGQQILEYAKECCQKFNIPFSIYKELIKIESGWKPDAAFHDPTGKIRSDASGLGQFLSTTWNGFLKHCSENNIYDEKWGPKPLSQQTKFNPYAMSYATAWLMNHTKNAFRGFDQKPFEEQAILYYLAHHEGVGGAKTYLKQLERGERPKRPFVMNLSKRIAALAARSDGIKLTKNRVYSQIDDGKESYNGKGLIDLKGGQTTWLFGSSSVLNGKFKGKPEIGRFGVIGDNTQSFYTRLQSYWPEIEPFIKEPRQKPKQIILMGLGANAPSNAMEGYRQIVNFLKSKGINNVKIGTVQEINQAMAKLNEEIRKTDNHIDFAKNTQGMTDGVHFSSAGYDVVYRMVQESA